MVPPSQPANPLTNLKGIDDLLGFDSPDQSLPNTRFSNPQPLLGNLHNLLDEIHPDETLPNSHFSQDSDEDTPIQIIHEEIKVNPP